MGSVNKQLYPKAPTQLIPSLANLTPYYTKSRASVFVAAAGGGSVVKVNRF